MNKTKLQSVTRLAKENDKEGITKLIEDEHFHTISDLINALASSKTFVFSSLPSQAQAKVIVRLNYRSKQSIIPKLTDSAIISFLNLNDEDDATDILQFLP